MFIWQECPYGRLFHRGLARKSNDSSKTTSAQVVLLEFGLFSANTIAFDCESLCLRYQNNTPNNTLVSVKQYRYSGRL